MTRPTIPAALLDAYERGEIDEPQMLRYLVETGGHRLDPPPRPTHRYRPDLSILGRLLHYVPTPPAPEGAAQRDFAKLLELPAEERVSTIRGAYKYYRSPELVELLLERSEEARTAHPPDARHFAELARVVLLQCPTCAKTDDLHVLQLVHLGAAAKACGDLAAAEQAFRTARATAAGQFAPGLRVEAECLFLEGSYRQDRRQLVAAEQLLRRALGRFDLLDDVIGTARTRITLSLCLFYSHRTFEAIAVIEAALPALPPDRQPRLHLMAQHNLVLYLAEAGQAAEAAVRFQANLPLYRSARSHWSTLRFHWLAGKIQRGLGRLVRAEDHLVRARDGFATHGTAYDAIMVCLDLALVYAAQRRHRELAELADLMLEGFAAQGLHDEAVAAVAFAAEAARQRRLTVEIARTISDFLLFAQHDPSLRCELLSS
jgi:tetratricopeptide (TPR) repeat protein